MGLQDFYPHIVGNMMQETVVTEHKFYNAYSPYQVVEKLFFWAPTVLSLIGFLGST
jgi:glycine cleavage system pyridoxal-binding protein P